MLVFRPQAVGRAGQCGCGIRGQAALGTAKAREDAQASVQGAGMHHFDVYNQ